MKKIAVKISKGKVSYAYIKKNEELHTIVISENQLKVTKENVYDVFIHMTARQSALHKNMVHINEDLLLTEGGKKITLKKLTQITGITQQGLDILRDKLLCLFK